MGRPAHKPTEQTALLVRRLSGMGVVVDDVALLTGISDKTVRKYYRAEIQRGRAEANLKVAQSMFQAATRPNNPNVIAGMFWLKNRAGWKDAVDAGGNDNRVTSITVNLVQPSSVDTGDVIEGSVAHADRTAGRGRPSGAATLSIPYTHGAEDDGP